mgnify:CR=1 FL=1|tara:strand:- start:12069 stop:12851 length:783 start_codon:yes stop_codon:yes gene_type:complete
MDNITLCQQINLPEGHSFILNMEGLILAVEHKSKEWCVHVNRHPIEAGEDRSVRLLNGQFSPVIGGKINRYINSDKTDVLEIKPTLADRAVVCRPLSPITIVPGAKVIIYLSIPMWFSMSLLGEQSILIKEIATQVLSDTWFGPSTMKGELCYASQTSARLNLDNLSVRQHRVTTPLIIENNADNDLIFERVSLPVPYLSIYRTENGQLWTQNATLTREDDGDFAKLKLGDAPVDTCLVSGPRITTHHGQLIRAFSAIFN